MKTSVQTIIIILYKNFHTLSNIVDIYYSHKIKALNNLGGVYTTPFSTHKTEYLLTILAFCLHANDENAYSKQRPLNLET